MVISGEKAVEQLEELLILMINSFEGVKDVIKFMSFEELEIVGFQTTTNLERKINKSNIGISELDDDESVGHTETIKSKSDENVSVSSEMEPATFLKMYDGVKEKRLKVQKESKSNNKLELSAMVDKVKNKFEVPKGNNESFDKGSEFPSENNSKHASHIVKTKGSVSNLSKNSKYQDMTDQTYGKSFVASPNYEKHTNDIKKFVFPDSVNIDFNADNAEEFIGKHWVELMEV
jgi:hypothetical protein